MWLGLFYAISACFVWGMIFVIPEFLPDFTGVEIVLGRYLIYGILSCALFFRKGFSRVHLIPKKAWGMAFAFALLSNILYYLGIVAGVRFVSAPLTVLVIGMAPILIALYGNWHAREIPFVKLIFPCLGMAIGLVLINIAEVDWTFTAYSIQLYVLGVLGVFVGLFGWSWYAVHNARFLKRNPHIPSMEWSSIIGVCTLIWALAMGFLFAFVLHKDVEISKFIHWSSGTFRFLVGVLILGVICSWLGCYLWNRASVYLPVSLMGPFLIFESLFGLLFVYSVDSRFPSLLEVIGVVSMLAGILLSVHIFRRQKYAS